MGPHKRLPAGHWTATAAFSWAWCSQVMSVGPRVKGGVRKLAFDSGRMGSPTPCCTCRKLRCRQVPESWISLVPKCPLHSIIMLSQTPTSKSSAFLCTWEILLIQQMTLLPTMTKFTFLFPNSSRNCFPFHSYHYWNGKSLAWDSRSILSFFTLSSIDVGRHGTHRTALLHRLTDAQRTRCE